jgi:hypothetical protein
MSKMKLALSSYPRIVKFSATGTTTALGDKTQRCNRRKGKRADDGKDTGNDWGARMKNAYQAVIAHPRNGECGECVGVCSLHQSWKDNS